MMKNSSGKLGVTGSFEGPAEMRDWICSGISQSDYVISYDNTQHRVVGVEVGDSWLRIGVLLCKMKGWQGEDVKDSAKVIRVMVQGV